MPNNGLPILNIDTYPGVYKVNASGVASQKIDRTYKTMVHEYQHLRVGGHSGSATLPRRGRRPRRPGAAYRCAGTVRRGRRTLRRDRSAIRSPP